MDRKNQLIKALRQENEQLRLTGEHLRHILEELGVTIRDADLQQIAEINRGKHAGRPGYDPDILAFAETIHTASPRVLEILRQFPDVVQELPSAGTLQRHFGEHIQQRMNELQDASCIPTILKRSTI